VAVVAILEDDEGRREAMLRHLALGEGLRVVVFPRAPDMIAWLRDHLDECALISLDHDLVSTVKGDDPGSGTDVVLFLGERSPICPVIVHTSNPLAAPGMIYFLRQGSWAHERVVPFNDLEWVEVAWAPTASAMLAGTHRYGESP
jgi:hypothetical protein